MPPIADKDRLVRLFAAFVERLNSDPALAGRLAELSQALGFRLDDLDATLVLDARTVPLRAPGSRTRLTPDTFITTTTSLFHDFWLGRLGLADFLAQSQVDGDVQPLLDIAASLPLAFAVYAETARRRRMTSLAAPESVANAETPAPAEMAAPVEPPATPAPKTRSRPRQSPTETTLAPEAPAAEVAAPPARPKSRSRKRPAATPTGEAAATDATPGETEPIPLAVEARESASLVDELPEVPLTSLGEEALAADTAVPLEAELEALDTASEAPAPEPPPPVAPPSPSRGQRGKQGGKKQASAPPPAEALPAPAATSQAGKKGKGSTKAESQPAPAAKVVVEAAKADAPTHGKGSKRAESQPAPAAKVAAEAAKADAPTHGKGKGRDKKRDAGKVTTALVPVPPLMPAPIAPSPVADARTSRLRAAIESLGRRLIPVVEGDAPRRKVERLDQALPTDEAALRLEILRRMTLIRAVESRLADEMGAQRLPAAELALSDGQEGVAVAAAFALRPEDNLITTHRSVGPFLARGSDPTALVAEIYGRAAGLNGGKGGPQNLSDVRVGALATAIVGASPVLALGFALAARLQKTEQVTLCLLGEGASNQGMFHEALNLAAVRSLPVVFVITNDGTADATPAEETSRLSNLAQRAVAYGMGNATVDGSDVWGMYRTLRAAVRVARNSGPTLVEVKVPRLSSLPEGQRDSKDALVRLYQNLVETKSLSPSDAREIAAAAQLQASRAVEWAQSAPNPPVEALTTFVYSPEPAALYRPALLRVATRNLSMAAAVREAQATALRTDPAVYLIGVGLASGGRFQTVSGLIDRYGPERVIDAPISPNAIIGSAVTAAAAGMRPIIDIGFGDFLTLAADPIVNQAAKLRYMTSGQYRAPLVIRVASGPAQGWGAQHSQSLEGWFAAVPGLLVAVPSSPYEAKGLLLTAVRSNNPVLFFEPKALYEATGPVPQDDYLVPFGVADVKRSGTDCTIVAVGAAVGEALAAAETLAADSISAEVIDPRTLMPFDWTTVLESAGRTGRLVIVEEAPITLGWGAEIAAQAATYLFGLLRAPIVRVAAAPVPVPYSPSLAVTALVGADQVIAAVRRLVREG